MMDSLDKRFINTLRIISGQEPLVDETHKGRDLVTYMWCSDDTLEEYWLHDSGKVTRRPSLIAHELNKMIQEGGETAAQACQEIERRKQELPYKGKSWF